MAGQAVPARLESPLEIATGAMLVALGAHVLWRLWRDRVHFHRHRHDDGRSHLHAHSHIGEEVPHERATHAHGHGFRWRSLAVGLMHGMAGSAALLVLTVSQIRDPFESVLYVLVFGIGSMVGMGALTSAIAVPLVLSALFLTWGNRSIQIAVGVVTIAIGVTTIYGRLVGQAG